MKKFPTRFLILALVFLGLCAGAFAQPEQPRMHGAIEFLRQAKTSADPLPSLENARRDLVHAKNNKRGWRVKAIGEVDEAIAAAKAGNHDLMEQKIDHTIADTWIGVDKASNESFETRGHHKNHGY